jgi:hypothetical protein
LRHPSKGPERKRLLHIEAHFSSLKESFCPYIVDGQKEEDSYPPLDFVSVYFQTPVWKLAVVASLPCWDVIVEHREGEPLTKVFKHIICLVAVA